MGWDDFLYSNPITAPLKGIYDLTYNNPAAPSGQVDNVGHTYTPNPGKNKTARGLAESIYTGGPSGYDQYGSIFDQGYQNLGQPLHDASDRHPVYSEGTRGLATAFADRVYQKTGKLPTEDQVRQFVAQNLTPSFAQKFIVGIAPDQLNAIADQYLDSNPETMASLAPQPAAQPAPEDRIRGLSGELDKIYETGKQNYVNSYNDTVYGPAKQNTANDLAGQGLLTQPTSRYSLDKVESNRGRDLASGLNTLESNRATGAVDLGKTIENLLQSQQQISNQNTQFGKTLSLQNRQFNANQDQQGFNNSLTNRQLSLADMLGRLQAGANKKDWTDYLNTGLNAAGTAAKVATLF